MITVSCVYLNFIEFCKSQKERIDDHEGIVIVHFKFDWLRFGWLETIIPNLNVNGYAI